jgi:DNA polymerase-1
MKDFYSHKKLVGIDIETFGEGSKGGLSPYSGDIALIQLAHDDGRVEILRLDQESYWYIKQILEDEEILKIGHNFKFDMKFFIKNRIYPREIFDTMVASGILYAGIDIDEVSEFFEAVKEDMESEVEQLFELEARKRTKSTKFSHSLQAVLKRELDVLLDKELQTSDWSRPLTTLQKEYAVKDVIYLIPLAKVLWDKILKEDLREVFLLESDLNIVLTYMEIVGVKIDAHKWAEKLRKEEEKLRILEEELQKEIYYRFVKKDNLSTSLFDDVEYKQINLKSPVKLAKILGLKNVSKQTLEKASSDPTIQKLIEYKKLAKEVSTYSDEYLKKLNRWNRLTSEYYAVMTATGRISSRNPNLQNVPQWFKQMIIAEEGYVPVFIDYSQVELRILAYLSGDTSFIQSANSQDLHSENARKIFKIPEDQPVPKDLRKKAKTVSFAIPYGTSAMGLYNRGFFDTLEEAKEAIQSFFESFPDVKRFLEESANSAVQRGYTRDAIGRIRRYQVPNLDFDINKYLDLYRAFMDTALSMNINKEIFDMGYENFKNTKLFEIFRIDKETFEKLAKMNSYFSKIASIRREGQNHPIQATSASITKTALVRLFDYLVKTGYGYITLSIHDSIFFEIRRDKIFEAIRNIVKIMEESGREIIGGNTPVDVEVGTKMEFVCKKCGSTYLDNQFYFDLDKEIIIDRTLDDSHNLCEECLKAIT